MPTSKRHAGRPQKKSAPSTKVIRTEGRTGSALVLDDNPDFRQHVGRILSQRFGVVYLAASCHENDLLLKKNKIDFALLDYMLDDGNGVELGVETRQRLGTTVVIVTGQILPPEEEQLCEEYDMLVLRKPFIVTDLLNFAERRTRAPTIFIGHGRSQEWKDLRYFLSTRLNLNCEEFNSESVAGIPTVVRLQQMLKNAKFAFLVMTSEDAHSDGSIHARENVIHEAGLFQGKLGFERAILLLEEGCSEFSNIHGLTHISFPKGRLDTTFEQIRLVLERERLIPAHSV